MTAKILHLPRRPLRLVWPSLDLGKEEKRCLMDMLIHQGPLPKKRPGNIRREKDGSVVIEEGSLWKHKKDHVFFEVLGLYFDEGRVVCCRYGQAEGPTIPVSVARFRREYILWDLVPDTDPTDIPPPVAA